MCLHLAAHVPAHALEMGLKHRFKSTSDFLTLVWSMNVPYAVLVFLAVATLVHLKLEYDRENEPDTVYERSQAINDAVLRREIP